MNPSGRTALILLKDRLATMEAIRIVDAAIREPFDHWLADNPQDNLTEEQVKYLNSWEQGT